MTFRYPGRPSKYGPLGDQIGRSISHARDGVEVRFWEEVARIAPEFAEAKGSVFAASVTVSIELYHQTERLRGGKRGKRLLTKSVTQPVTPISWKDIFDPEIPSECEPLTRKPLRRKRP